MDTLKGNNLIHLEQILSFKSIHEEQILSFKSTEEKTDPSLHGPFFRKVLPLPRAPDKRGIEDNSKIIFLISQ